MKKQTAASLSRVGLPIATNSATEQAASTDTPSANLISVHGHPYSFHGSRRNRDPCCEEAHRAPVAQVRLDLTIASSFQGEARGTPKRTSDARAPVHRPHSSTR